jgi:hypothetical protein
MREISRPSLILAVLLPASNALAQCLTLGVPTFSMAQQAQQHCATIRYGAAIRRRDLPPQMDALV